MTIEKGCTGTEVEKTLYGLKDNPEFWFFEDIETDKISRLQHDYTRQEIKLESDPGKRLMVQAGTLGAEPENKPNEDTFMILPFGEGRMLFSVIDGASSQKEISGLSKHGVKGSFYISHLLSEGFSLCPEYHDLCQKDSLTAGTIMRVVNRWLFSNLAKIEGVDYSDYATIPGMSTTFALVNGRDGLISVAHVADTEGVVETISGDLDVLTFNQNARFDEETLGLMRRLAGEYGCHIGQVKQIEEGASKIKTQVINSYRRKINTPGGCGILNGMPELVTNKLIYETKIALDKVRSILLASDGALLPYTLTENDKPGNSSARYLQLLKVLGGENLLTSGAAVLMEDINFELYPRSKLRDDATFMQVVFLDKN